MEVVITSTPVTSKVTSFAEGSLFVTDSRTSLEYEIPITRNAVSANDFKRINGQGANTKNKGKPAGGLRLYDPGLENTAIKESKITSQDAASGLPMYRGYTTMQLWDSEFEDLLHLMAWESYPSKSQKESLRHALAQEMTRIPENVIKVIRTFPRSSPPMPMILAGMAAYVASDPQAIPAIRGKNIYQGNIAEIDKAIVKSVAAYAVTLGLTASHRKGIKFVPASVDNSFFDNLFTMMGHVDPDTKRPDPLILSCFRHAAILNADNGMTQSTFVMLTAASSLPDPMSCLISALAACYGPLHYGAQEAAYQNLKQIGKPENVPAFLEEVKRGERRLFGFGHRSFKTEDPRLDPVKGMLKELKATASSNPLLAIAYEIERIASVDPYFTSRNLCANADFYTVFLFIAMGFDAELITAANMSQRLIGLMSQWRESMLQKTKLFRPLHIYTGPAEPVSSLPSKL